MTYKYEKGQDLILYYDLSAYNNHPDGKLSKLSFIDTRLSALLEYPANYYMSVTRFELSTLSLPVMIAPIYSATPSNVLLKYRFALRYQNFIQDGYVSYEANIYNGFYSGQPLDDPYFYIYSYQKLCDMINNALNILMFNLITQINDAPTTTGWLAPVVTYDPSTQLFSFEVQNALFCLAFSGSNPVVEILMNDDAAQLFHTMPMQKVIDSYTTSAGCNNQVIFPARYTLSTLQTYLINNNNTSIGPQTILSLSQESSTIGFLNPIQSIVFTSTSITVVPSCVSLPKVYGSPVILENEGGNNNNLNSVITDFVVPFSPFSTYKNYINYEPTAQYRMLSLTGSQPLDKVDISVYWKDWFNNLHPLYLEKGGYASLKILFQRKDANP
jgi:hypothetical protein